MMLLYREYINVAITHVGTLMRLLYPCIHQRSYYNREYINAVIISVSTLMLLLYP
jgi:hypothetical protein